MQRLGSVLMGALALTGATLCFAKTSLNSGIDKGGMLSPYTPTHVTGADQGTNTCPVCKYPLNPAVQVWINTDDQKNIDALVTTLEKETRAHASKKLKAFVVFINPKSESSDTLTARLKAIAAKDKVKNVALAFLPGPSDDAVQEYAINTDAQVKNTIFVYKARKVDTKFVNFSADDKGLNALDSAIDNVVTK